ncbi:MAG: ankyrin repeat domain-containing protein [Burkholderiaceae bacterium]|nr:MAG: ankyrin repeat domain-containing protein [Burkholderiaceae bacterium]
MSKKPTIFSMTNWVSRSMVGFAAFVLCLSAAVASSSEYWLDVANNRVDDVKSALAQGEDPNAISPNGQPALMLAIREGSWGVYDILLAHRRINVNIENRNHETPLMYLAIVGDLKRAKALIARGAHVNRLGWTPLHYAASKGNLAMVKLLIADKAIINAPSPDGTTPLMMAAFSGSENVVNALLEAGADATTRNLKHQSAADWARLGDHTDLAGKLDQLSKKIMAERAAMYARDHPASAGGAAGMSGAGGEPSNGGNGQASQHSGQDDVKAVDIRPSAVPPALTPDKRPATTQSQSSDNSTSRYFDLKRFDTEPVR